MALGDDVIGEVNSFEKLSEKYLGTFLQKNGRKRETYY